MSIDKARDEMNEARKHIQAAIDHLIDARLSPAPVGGDAYAQAITAGCYPLDDAPTPPPAEPDGGDAWTEEKLRDHAKKCGWYTREGTSVPNILTGGWSHPFHVTVGSRELVELLNAATKATIAERDRRIAALEAGLERVMNNVGREWPAIKGFRFFIDARALISPATDIWDTETQPGPATDKGGE